MEFDVVDSLILKEAIQIQNNIFPKEHGDDDIRSSVQGDMAPYFSLLEYYLPKVDGKYVGICGLYAYKEYPHDIWLGWFGVLQNHRKKGYGSKILSQMIGMAKNMGYKTFRLYTDDVENVNAISLYKKFGMTQEVYARKQDFHREKGKTLIFSLSLNNEKCDKWNNKDLHLNDHDKRNQII